MHEHGLADVTLRGDEADGVVEDEIEVQALRWIRIVQESQVVMIGGEWLCADAAERHDDIGAGDGCPGDVPDDSTRAIGHRSS